MKKVIACQLAKWSDHRLGRLKFCEGPRKLEGRKRLDTFFVPPLTSLLLFFRAFFLHHFYDNTRCYKALLP